VVFELRKLFAERDIGSMIAHHSKKNIKPQSVGEASQDDSRGAGAITSQMRVVLSMRPLSMKDAVRLGIPADIRHNIITLSKGAKANYSERDPTGLMLRKHTVEANNGTDEFKADRTVALAVYSAAGAVGFRLSDDQRDAVLAAMKAGAEFRASKNAKRNAVKAIADMLGMSLDQIAKDGIAGALADWEAKGFVKVVEDWSNDARRNVELYKVGPNTPPPAADFGAVDDEEEDDF